MIKTYKCKETEKLFYGKFIAKLPQAIQRTAAIKLKMLNAVSLLEPLRVPPSNYLEELHFDREGQHCIRINKQWRICFKWQSNGAYNVEIVEIGRAHV